LAQIKRVEDWVEERRLTRNMQHEGGMGQKKL